MRWLLPICAIALSTACTPEVTEIIFRVDTDLQVPAEIDRFRIEAGRSEAADMRMVAEADLTTTPPPRSLTIVHRDGPLGPIDVRVIALSGADQVVMRRLRVTFVSERSLVLSVSLDRACAGVSCLADTTCQQGSCRAIDVGPCEFDDATCTGDGGADAGPPVDSCGSEEACNGLDDDCDGDVDETFDLTSDPQYCGRCDRSCPNGGPHTTDRACVEGSCALLCDTGWGDCNRDPVDGCEIDTETDSAHCGGCGAFCPAAGSFHATDSVCTGGRCLLSCETDWGDCDGDPANGCETHVSVDSGNCGTCDNQCPDGQMCRMSVCS